jgi:hypothetical protein
MVFHSFIKISSAGENSTVIRLRQGALYFNDKLVGWHPHTYALIFVEHDWSIFDLKVSANKYHQYIPEDD